MSAWWRGWTAGALAALAAALLLAGGSRADLYARVTSGGGFLLDVRLDESTVGRALRLPAATLGEATATKRSWLILSVYEFRLRLRPEVAPEARGALQELQLSARLPGSVVATNATRVSAGTAVWETLPPEVMVRTRGVHWLRLVLVLAVVAAAAVFGRR